MKKGATHNKRKRATDCRANSSGIKHLLYSSLFGAGMGICIMLAIILLASALCTMLDDPHKFVSPLCIFSVFSAAFFAGLIARKKNKSMTLLCGAVCGMIILVFIWILSAILKIGFQSNSTTTSSFILDALIIPTTCFGAIIGSSSDKNSRRHGKRR